jgi:hypothetical protein
MYWYINVQTSTCQYVQVHTCTYAYTLFLALFKKSANRSRTRNLVHNSPRVYPCAMGLQTLMPVKVRNYVSVYIIWFCQTPCQCTWRLMTNRRCRTRRAAAPSHDIPRARPRLDVSGSRGSLATIFCRLTEDLIRKRQCLDSCQVISTQHWAIPSQRPTHLVVGTPGRPLELEL